MLQTELCRHPAIQTVAYSPHTYLETHWWLMGAVLLDQPAQLYTFGNRYDGYGSRSNTRAYMVDLLEKCVPDFAIPSDDRALVFAGWEALCTAYARPVFFEKSPQFLSQWAALSLMLEWIGTTDHEVKIIGMVRNPHGVQYSAQKLFGSDPEDRQFAWATGCRNLLALERVLPPEAYKFVKYEDLLARPTEAFSEITDFIGVPADAACGSGARPETTQKWRTDPGYGLQLHPSVRQIARTFGYREDELSNTGAAAMGAPVSARGGADRVRHLGNRLRHKSLKPLLLRARRVLKLNKG